MMAMGGGTAVDAAGRASSATAVVHRALRTQTETQCAVCGA